MSNVLRFIGYFAFGVFSALGDVTFRGWVFWALLAALILVDVSHVFED